MKFLVLFSFFLLATASFSQTDLTVEKIWKDYAYFGKSVQGFRGMNNPDYFSKFSSHDDKRVISKHEVVHYKGKGEVIVDVSKLKWDGANIQVDNYSFNRDESKMLFTTNTNSIYRRSFTANYFIYDIDTKHLAPLDEKHSPQLLAEYSPDGKSVAYIFENNLYVKDLDSKEVTQITNDGERNRIINGTTDWVYEEEFAITKAFYWSPDSKKIAFLRFDESDVKEFTMAYYYELYPQQYTFKYPKAGEDNSKVSLHIASLEDNSTEAITLPKYEYIPRLAYSNSNNLLLVQTMNRHQNELSYYKINTSTDNYSAELFHQEKSKTYIDVDDNLLFLKNENAILRTSEKDGWNHIYKVNFDGKETQLTNGEWDVIDLYGVTSKHLYYSAAKKSAINKGVYQLHIKKQRCKAITPEIGQNNANFTKGMKYFIHSSSTANSPSTYKLCSNTGEVITTMEDNGELKKRLEKHELAEKEFAAIELDGRTLNAWMLKPTNFNANKEYPVYISIYGGPGSNTVNNGWGGVNFMFHQLLAQEGYIVVSVDPRGTMYRGAAFKKSTYLQLGKLETEDFIAAAKYLQDLPYVDKDRIGIQGWSYGGFMTSLAMTKGADYFKMGIAVAPVTNWRYYDNIYTERFMRTPAENKDGYDQNSPIHFVDKLKGKYLLIHGSGDDNVHYQNTMEMVNALVAANKQFDLFIYPNKNHGIYGGNTRNHLFTMILDYTKENL